ncbi:MAG: thioredoxin-dependent thiol peroxidase [Bacteroidetes bacterium]|nr:thioredoxin-dependent thiol peroxidase [Bacteroidota bacterium]
MTKSQHQTVLQEGDNAPDFSFINSEGKKSSLKNLKGKRIILYFYPKDDTPGCIAESSSLRDNYRMLKKKGYEVIGVSKDNKKSHVRFSKKFKLPFTLIPDTKKKIIKSYDVWGKTIFMGKIFDWIVRTTFVIDEKGKIKKIIRNVDTARHAEQILNDLGKTNMKSIIFPRKSEKSKRKGVKLREVKVLKKIQHAKNRKEILVSASPRLFKWSN